MASKIAIVGDVNSGKSWSRRYIENGENTFLLHPSQKLNYLTKSDGSPVETFLYTPASAGGRAKIQNWEDVLALPTFKMVNRPAEAIAALDREFSKYDRKMIRQSLTPDVLSGNTMLVNKDIKDAAIFMGFISRWMPWIKTIIIPDFTHFISAVVSDDEFISRRIGNEAYQKFWELSADLLRTFILSIDDLRDDLIVVIEFHTSWDEKRGRYELFVPAGQMLKEKFKPDSYFDVMLFTDVLGMTDDKGEEQSVYRFVTRRTTLYPQARSSDIFDTLYIPNNLANVLELYRQKKGIPEFAEDKRPAPVNMAPAAPLQQPTEVANPQPAVASVPISQVLEHPTQSLKAADHITPAPPQPATNGAVPVAASDM